MARRSTARAVARSRGGPETCGPGSCMAPYPIRATGRPARTAVPPGGSIRWWTVVICSLLSSQSGLRLSTLRGRADYDLAHVDVGRLFPREPNSHGPRSRGHGDPTLNSVTEITPPAP